LNLLELFRDGRIFECGIEDVDGFITPRWIAADLEFCHSAVLPVDFGAPRSAVPQEEGFQRTLIVRPVEPLRLGSMDA